MKTWLISNSGQAPLNWSFLDRRVRFATAPRSNSCFFMPSPRKIRPFDNASGCNPQFVMASHYGNPAAALVAVTGEARATLGGRTELRVTTFPFKASLPAMIPVDVHHRIVAARGVYR
jgi:hypothetical protein